MNETNDEVAREGTSPPGYVPPRFPKLRFLAEIIWALVAIGTMTILYVIEDGLDDVRRWFRRRRKRLR